MTWMLLSDSELRARLHQRGIPHNDADQLVNRRDNTTIAEKISDLLDQHDEEA